MIKRRVLVVYGTRPEAIKLAPLISALRKSKNFDPIIAVTGQHRHMLDQVNRLFGIAPEYDLEILKPRQQLHELTTKALAGLTDTIRSVEPDIVIVQGDTTTSFAAALAAFYEKVPIAHVEAGLRTGNRLNPFPEEINRKLTSQLATVHLAPTECSRSNLLREDVRNSAIYVTGNTVIDALLDVVARRLPLQDQALNSIPEGRLILVTTHRRESWGPPMARTARALARLAREYNDVQFLVPMHLNPAVREVLMPPLAGLRNVLATEPLGYADFANMMNASHIILTDSGGVQEEAPSLGKPVLVLRENTERPEAVDAGTVKLVGTDEAAIITAVRSLLSDQKAYDRMAQAVNPYGDGHAAIRSVRAIEHYFRLSARPASFNPA